MTKMAAGFHVIFLLVVIFFGSAVGVVSGECLDPSPSVSAGKRPSDPISVRELSETEHMQVKAILKSLDGKWKGNAREIRCNLADLNDQDVNEYTIKARSSTSRSGNVLLEAEFYSSAERTTHQKTLRFYLVGNLLRIHHDGGIGDVELIQVSDNNIEFRYKRRSRYKGGTGLVFHEFAYRLATDAEGISLYRQVYTQGRLSSQYEWHFRRYD